MRTLRSVLLVSAVMVLFGGVMPAQNSTMPSDSTPSLVQARTIYLVSGHVKYFKTKGFKTHLVEDSPFEEPSHNELEKWGRFQVVQDAKSADLWIRVYETGTFHPVPVGVVNTGSGVIILDVVSPASKKILWYTCKNLGLSWSTKTAVSGLFKNLREYMESQENAATPSVPSATVQPVAAK
jgi:hypothetical protein